MRADGNIRLQRTQGFTSGQKPALKSQGEQHEKFSETASGARGNSDGGRRIERAFVRARRRRGGKYPKLAGLSAASSGIAAAIVTTRRATVLRLPAQGATSASLSCAVRIASPASTPVFQRRLKFPVGAIAHFP